jgi:hypothetical protein
MEEQENYQSTQDNSLLTEQEEQIRLYYAGLAMQSFIQIADGADNNFEVQAFNIADRMVKEYRKRENK